MRKILLLLALVPAAAPAGAQADFATAPSRFSLSAFTGVRVPFVTGEMAGVDSLGRELFYLREKRGGNPILGIEGRAWIAGPLSLVAAGVYSQGGDREFFATDTIFGQVPDILVRSGSNVLFARIGASARIEPQRELVQTGPRPSTDLFAGLALVRELEANSPALNLGFSGVLPVGRGVAFTLGLEDYFVFWNRQALQGRFTDRFRGLSGAREAGYDRTDMVHLFYDTSNILLLRAGVSLRP